MTRRLLAVLALLAALGAALGATVGLRTDLVEFLPPGRTPASTFLLRELEGGAATTLLLAGIEGADPAELARLSRETAAGLRQSGRFALVADGTTTLTEAEQALLFRHRYLLSFETVPGAFTAAALRPRLEALLDGLRSSAAPLVARFGFADPTGAFLGLARTWLGEAGTRLEVRDGAWFARPVPPGGPRALLLARAAGAGGLDADAQGDAIAAFRAAFDAARPPPGARLLLSGPGVFAAEAAGAIRADVRMVTIASALALAGFLWWRFRSLALMALAAVPLGCGIVAGYAAAALASGGAVHGIAFGFAMTMLGVTVDHPILLLTLRRPGEALAEAASRIWPTLRLAAGAAAVGLSAMLGSGLPGLVQLGIFAGTGVLAAAAATRWLLPLLVAPGTPPALPRPLPGPVAAALSGLRGRPRLTLAALLLAAVALLAAGGPAWQRDLSALSPVPAAAQALDQELRNALGAPDVRMVIALGPAPDEEAVLRLAERLGAALAPLAGPGGALAGLDLPSLYLPSTATQRARAAALPDPETLRAALGEAGAGLPFRPGAFAPFLAAVEESRAGLPPLTPQALAEGAPTLAARLAPLLVRHGAAEAWGIALARGVADPAALAGAIARIGDPAILLVDVKAETEGLLAAYGRATILWAFAGLGLVLLLLAAGLGPLRAGLVALPVLGAELVTLAVLVWIGEELTLFHMASLLLLAGLAMDYSLFLRRAATGPEGGRDDETLGAVLTCAVSTLLTFGLLALCQTPVLHGIGLTVSIGVAAAFLLACGLAPRRG